MLTKIIDLLESIEWLCWQAIAVAFDFWLALTVLGMFAGAIGWMLGK